MIGFVSDVMGAPVVVPMDFLTTQVQTSKSGEGALSVLRRTLREKGAMAFYNGFSGYVAGSWQPAVQFTVYDQLKQTYLGSPTTNATAADAATPPPPPPPSALTAAEAFLLGALAKVLSELATYPAEMARVVQQSTSSGLCDLPFAQILARVAEQEGVAGLYKGGAPLFVLALVVYWVRIICVSACLCVLCERVINTPIAAGIRESVCVRCACLRRLRTTIGAGRPFYRNNDDGEYNKRH
jgi:hypothetical protein